MSAAISLEPLSVPKASDVLASELRERILSGQIPEGSVLPSERDMVSQTKLSRATVREALRTLEVEGLVNIRAGRGGGTFTCQPTSDGVVRSLELFVRGRRLKLNALVETREAIEPYCAALAAARRTDDDLARLDAAHTAMSAADESPSAFLAANLDWHLAVADASHNDLLSAFMHALSRPVYTATNSPEFVGDNVRLSVLRAHRSVTDAIRRTDPAAAERRMRRHLHEYAIAALQIEEHGEIDLTPSAALRRTGRSHRRNS